MPTISQLPSAVTVTDADNVPISQGGVARAASVGTLLAGLQPAITIDSPSLLGRISIGPGGPEQVDVGNGLALNAGTLVANGADHASFAIESALQPSDEFVISSSGAPKLVQATLLRSIFSPGSNITIDSQGVISSNIGVSSSGSTDSSFAIATLPSASTISAVDLLAVSQSGSNHSITYSGLLNGQTIDMAQPAGAAADTDTFWVGQGTAVLVRQTFGELWSWIENHVLSSKLPVLELVSDTSLDGVLHNGRILVCSQPLALSATPADLGSGFSCNVINVSPGNLTCSNGFYTSTGNSTIAPGQTASLRCISYSGGTIVYALISSPIGSASVPGPVVNLSAAGVSVTTIALTWAPPGSGGAAATYTVQYRVSGSTSWTVASAGLISPSFTITNLAAGVSYDCSVFASNAVGAGQLSAIVTASTSASLAMPGQVTDVTASPTSGTSVTVNWSPPITGGPTASYTVQYRQTGSTSWSTAVAGATVGTQLVSGLSPGVSYDFAVTAGNAAGSGPLSTVVSVTTSTQAGAVTSITWNLLPSGSYVHGSGSIGVNAHVSPATAAIQFGFSNSSAVPPSSWTPGAFVNTNLWGAYVSVPSTSGSWYVWAEGTDGSCATVYQEAFSVT
jgi:hypothetical protein